MWQTYLTVALVSYLLGSIPFGYILVKLFLKQDIRQTGSGNIGATNVARSGKKGLAIATLLLDAAKGYFGVVLALFVVGKWGDPQYASVIGNNSWHLSTNVTFYASASPADFQQFIVHVNQDSFLPAFIGAFAAIVGHCFPIWLKFRGGKGVATALGAFVFVFPLGVAFAAVMFICSFFLTRYVSASSVLAALSFLLFTPFCNPLFAFPWTMMTLSGACLTIILKHHANIRRLLNGTEPRFTTKKAVPSDPIQAERNA